MWFLITLCYFFGVNSILICQRRKFLHMLYTMHWKVQYYEKHFSGQVTTVNIAHRKEFFSSQKSSAQVLKLWPSSTYDQPHYILYKFDLCPYSNGSYALAGVFWPHFASLQIILKNLTNQEVATFTYGEWLSKLKNAKGSLVCEMPAVVNDEQMMEDTTYTLQVKTSDIGGMFMVHVLWLL